MKKIVLLSVLTALMTTMSGCATIADARNA